MSEDPKTNPQIDDLLLRVEMLERDNQRLREKIEPVLGPDNPNFNSQKFLKALSRVIAVVMIPLGLFPALMVPLIFSRRLPPMPRIGPFPLVDAGGVGTRHPGVGFGIIAVGGGAVGIVAIGGFGFGIVALGGGAVGVLALGGGSFGIVAIGGGSVGYIALGGGAVGVYAMGQRGAGRYVLALNRQDQEAIEFFKRWVPGVRAAVTNPMPVLPLPQQNSA